jgi:hypothetical protein
MNRAMILMRVSKDVYAMVLGDSYGLWRLWVPGLGLKNTFRRLRIIVLWLIHSGLGSLVYALIRDVVYVPVVLY